MLQCARCAKGSVIRGKRRLLRGHYNPVSYARKYPNLQWAVVPVKGGKGKRMKICTACLRTLRKK